MIVQKNIFATILSYLQNQVISEIVDEVPMSSLNNLVTKLVQICLILAIN